MIEWFHGVMENSTVLGVGILIALYLVIGLVIAILGIVLRSPYLCPDLVIDEESVGIAIILWPVALGLMVFDGLKKIAIYIGTGGNNV